MWLAGSLCLCLNLVTASSIGLLLHLSGLLWAGAGGAAERGIRKEHSADPICADHIPVASCNQPQQTVVVTICVLKVLTICSRNSFPYTYFIFNLDPFQILGEANTCLFSTKKMFGISIPSTWQKEGIPSFPPKINFARVYLYDTVQSRVPF